MARFFTSLRTLSLVTPLVLAACGDDSAPVPCTIPSAEACSCDDGRSGVRMCLPTMSWGGCVCTDGGTDSSVGLDGSTMDATPDGSVDAAMDSMRIDAGVTWPATPDDYAPAYASRIDSLTIPLLPASGPADCCRDFGAISRDNRTAGTDEIDNAFSALADATIELGLDLQSVLDSNLASGQLSILLDHQGFDGDPDAAFILAALDGIPNGTGGYLIDRATFVPGSGTPRSLFEPAALSGGSLTAGPGELTLELPFAGVSLAYTFQDVRIEGTVTVATGVTYTAGTISGYLPVDDYFGGINDFVASSCSCLGLTGPLYSRSGTTWSNQCLTQTEVDALCSAPADAPCREIGAGTDCTASPLLITSLADLDTNASTPGFESLSLGLRFTARPVVVTGVTP